MFCHIFNFDVLRFGRAKYLPQRVIPGKSKYQKELYESYELYE